MVAADLKAETMSLIEQSDAIESEMNSIIHRLSQPGGPGISGSLVDSEGFPRADFDIPVIHAQRQRLSELRNDYDKITDRISEHLRTLHSAKLSPNKSAASKSSVLPASLHGVLPKDASSLATMGSTSLPFAIVDEIADVSPAAEDGLQLGDQIVKFGNVESGDNLLSRLASEGQSNQGNQVPTTVLRQGGLVNLNVTPRSWNGRGLLGCHFRIL
ncbi:26S proteasome non-ATPase regulatory subunit 9-like [Papaver somniferum]|uniref:26S proteasome non-ATPase regulatory subunit 9-like n=1 Tax=Papaver somniferum TaxID=3469 RepID=UPI000E70562C|nr:26S proteasome non-ATPase regulatory subunit 9-like [Papaver somniferum]